MVSEVGPGVFMRMRVVSKMERKMLAARKELVETLKSVISDSADDILSKTLSKLSSESPTPLERIRTTGRPRKRVFYP